MPALKMTARLERCYSERLGYRSSGFAFVARKVEPGAGGEGPGPRAARRGQLRGGEARVPDEGSATQALGLAGMDNNGLAGSSWSTTSSSAARRAARSCDATRPGSCPEDAQGRRSPAGQDVRLTLDEDIQYTAEDVLAADPEDLPRQGGHGGGHGPAHRRDLRHGERAAGGPQTFG